LLLTFKPFESKVTCTPIKFLKYKSALESEKLKVAENEKDIEKEKSKEEIKEINDK
jgi:hypothetical protein